MAIPRWPTTLPLRPLKAGFSEQYPNNLLRSDSEAGVTKVRRKGAAKPWLLTVPLSLTATQRQILISFVKDTLFDGALRFAFSHPVTDADVEVRIVPGDGLFEISPAGLKYVTTIKLEVLP